MPYQTFEDRPGLSDSPGKLAALALPADLTGKSVLDVGCGEGFFCRAALERGARRVLGVDSDAAALAEARARAPGAELLHASWWDLPPERFDVILLLGALEEEADQRRLLDHLASFLAPGGLLVVETPMVLDWARSSWDLVMVEGSVRRVPTSAHLVQNLMRSYGARVKGQAPRGKGEKRKRYVVHGRLREPTLLLVAGRSGHGKTSFAHLLARHGVRVVHLDEFMMGLQAESSGYRGLLAEFLRAVNARASISAAVNRMGPAEVDEFCRLVAETLSRDDDLTVVEGYVLTKKEVASRLAALTEARGFRLHRTSEVGTERIRAWRRLLKP